MDFMTHDHQIGSNIEATSLVPELMPSQEIRTSHRTLKHQQEQEQEQSNDFHSLLSPALPGELAMLMLMHSREAGRWFETVTTSPMNYWPVKQLAEDTNDIRKTAKWEMKLFRDRALSFQLLNRPTFYAATRHKSTRLSSCDLIPEF